MRKDLTLSAGVRQEFQSHIGGLHLAPRGGIAWSPFKSGKTTVRAGGGIFFDWLDAQTYSRACSSTARTSRSRRSCSRAIPIAALGGTRRDPAGGTRAVRRRSRAAAACAKRSPVSSRRCRARCASTRCTSGGAARTCCAASTSTRRSRTACGPDPAAGHRHRDPVGRRASQLRRDQRQRQLHAAAAAAVPRRELHARPFARRGRQRVQPAGGQLRSRRPSAGPSLGYPRHRFMSIVNLPLKERFRLGTSLRVQSALPYNITTGRDDNGDTVSNDRPAGVTRNSGRGRAQVDLGLRLSWSIGVRRPGGAAGWAAGPHPARRQRRSARRHAGRPRRSDKRYTRGALRAGVQRAEPHQRR